MEADDRPRCSARSKQSGERCKRRPIAGGFVCHMHGGAAGPTREAARLRLAAAADPAAKTLVDLLDADEYDSATRHRAAVAVLDRAGLAAGPARLEVSGPDGGAISLETQVQHVAEVIEGALQDLGIVIDDRVRRVLAARCRAMAAAQHVAATNA